MTEGAPLKAHLARYPDDYQSLRDAIAWLDREEERRRIDHIVRLSAFSAPRAMAHLLMELHNRLDAVDMVEAGRFVQPLAQSVLGELLGVTEVHANRVLKQMRGDGLIEMGSGWICLTDLPALADIIERPNG